MISGTITLLFTPTALKTREEMEMWCYFTAQKNINILLLFEWNNELSKVFINERRSDNVNISPDFWGSDGWVMFTGSKFTLQNT